MEIKAFDGNKWVKPTKFEGAEFKVEYPTTEQKFKLDSIVEDSTVQKDGQPIWKVSGFNKWVRYYVKFTVKDWKGLTAQGKEIKCKVKDNELDSDLWEKLVADDELAVNLYDAINEKLKWEGTPKKK